LTNDSKGYRFRLNYLKYHVPNSKNITLAINWPLAYTGNTLESNIKLLL